MSFFERYELVRLLREGQSKSFQARERATGKPVLFHMLSGEASGGPARLPVNIRELERLPKVIEVGEFANAPYLVTECIEGFQSIEEWIREQAPTAAQSPTAGQASTAAPEPAGASEPGEFTRYFLGLAPEEHSPPRSLEPVTPDVEVAGQWPASSAEPGEFTRFFGPAMQGESMDIEQERARQQANPESAAAPFAQPGEFTRMFGPAPGRSSQDTDLPLSAGLLSTSTDLLIPTRQGTPEEAPEGSAASEDSGKRPPSEYTRVIGLPQPAGAESQPAASAAPQPAPTSRIAGSRGARRWLLPVVLVAAATLLALLALWLWTGRRQGESGKGAMGISSPAATIR